MQSMHIDILIAWDLIISKQILALQHTNTYSALCLYYDLCFTLVENIVEIRTNFDNTITIIIFIDI